MKGSYDFIARYYDQLSRLVFGDTLVQAQRCFLDSIPTGSRVLIAGGGSGWILEAISSLHHAGLDITFIDSSSKMIGLAKRKATGNNKVAYINAAIEHTSLIQKFDLVITPFFFDNFSITTARKIFAVLHSCLEKDGTWINCDFRNTNNFRQKIQLRLMYKFFRIFCGIEARQLPDMEACFRDYGYVIAEQSAFRSGFVVSHLYVKE